MDLLSREFLFLALIFHNRKVGKLIGPFCRSTMFVVALATQLILMANCLENGTKSRLNLNALTV